MKTLFTFAVLLMLAATLWSQSKHSALLVESTWHSVKSGFVEGVPCNSPVPQGVSCTKDVVYDDPECPPDTIASFPIESDFFDWDGYHKRGGKVWCLLPEPEPVLTFACVHEPTTHERVPILGFEKTHDICPEGTVMVKY